MLGFKDSGMPFLKFLDVFIRHQSAIEYFGSVDSVIGIMSKTFRKLDQVGCNMQNQIEKLKLDHSVVF